MKQKRTLKDRLKSFFTLPEEVLQEEPSREFKNKPLVNLTRNKIFVALAAFFLVVNALVLFDIQFLYLRQIFGFLFLALVPGLLIMLCFKIREIKFWEYLVYTVGLSIAFIMFGGLAVNWTLPALGITDKPLSLYPILICFDIFLIALGVVAWKRNEDLTPKNPIRLSTPKLDATNNIFFIIPMLFPILSVLGAFLLNNHGPNILTMIMLGGIAVYVFLLVLFRKKLNENVYPWALWMMSLALLLSFSMRSWFVSGMDTNLEFSIFNMTEHNNFWSINSFKNTYNAMLSVTILPTVLSFFIKINLQYIQKFIFSAIFSSLPLIVYLISKKYFNHFICFSSSLFFIFQIGFMRWNEIPSRQEIAYIFFGLAILVLFTKKVNAIIKKTFFVIFGISMIVSHYSTAYIALAIFTLTYIIVFFYKKYEGKKIKEEKLYSSQKTEFYLTGGLVLLLLIFGFLWYSQVTPTANGLIDFAHKSISNLGNLFGDGVQSEGNSPLDQFNILPKKQEASFLLTEYEKSLVEEYDSEKEGVNYKIYPLYVSGIKPRFPSSVGFVAFSFREFLKVLGKIFIIFGFFYLIFDRRAIRGDFKFFSISGFLLLVLLLMLPFISIQYDVIRTYQQLLIVLSGIAILGALTLFKKTFKTNLEIIISLFLILYFLALCGIFYQVIGGNDLDLKMNNIGIEYSSYYVQALEIQSSKWLDNNYLNRDKINSDGKASARIFITSNPNIYFSLVRSLYPSFIKKENYVYISYSNKIHGVTSTVFRGNSLSFNLPTKIINKNKNRIYNNGGSEIFK